MDRDHTPVKSMSAIFENESPTGFQSIGEDEKMSSPAYVKWDFDLPSVPEKIKNEALELSREINEHKLIRRRNRNRSSPYCSFRNFQISGVNPLDGTPTRNSSYSRSVNLLKEALGDFPKSDNEEKDNDGFPANEKDNNKSDDDILFDDSFNDCLNECSQSIETDFYKQSTSTICVESGATNKTSDENKSKMINSPSGSRTGTDDEQKHVADLSKEIDEVDDHLFLEIDLNSLY